MKRQLLSLISIDQYTIKTFGKKNQIEDSLNIWKKIRSVKFSFYLS